MKKKRVLLWFRNDLRLHDNEALVDACNTADEVFPVFIFDPRLFEGFTSFGFRKVGKFRAKFILEAVKDLRNRLRVHGSDLIVRKGLPEEILFDLAKSLQTSWLFCNRERTDEEVKIQDKLERNLWSIGQEVRYSRGKMLYYTSDLPFPVTHTPDSFTQFRREVEKIIQVRPELPIPSIPAFSANLIELGDLHDMIGYNLEPSPGGVFELHSTWRGGETAGLNRLNRYIGQSLNKSSMSLAYNGEMMDTSHLSPYLSQGCLSPKKVFQALCSSGDSGWQMPSFRDVFHHLLLRDFFRLSGKKHGNAIFKPGGIKGEVRTDLIREKTLFKVWSEGRTGFPLVDAAMRQLNTTGYIPFGARYTAANFLVNELHIDWRMGAEYFESLLLDYDPCSNYVNWNQVAGLGNDVKEYRNLSVHSLAKKYDPNGSYVRQWLPELSALAGDQIHSPFTLSEEESIRYGIELGRQYPKPILSLAAKD